MFSREGGSPVWVPAFAGKQAFCSFSRRPAERVRGVDASSIPSTLHHPGPTRITAVLHNPSMIERGMESRTNPIPVIPAQAGISRGRVAPSRHHPNPSRRCRHHVAHLSRPVASMPRLRRSTAASQPRNRRLRRENFATVATSTTFAASRRPHPSPPRLAPILQFRYEHPVRRAMLVEEGAEVRPHAPFSHSSRRAFTASPGGRRCDIRSRRQRRPRPPETTGWPETD